eukprot:gene10150-2570_t
MIQPEFVLTTGDLTHALLNGRSEQNYEEWKFYMNTLEKNGLYKSDFWFDLKGNHDSFNVKGMNEKKNYFKDFSVSRQFDNNSIITHIHKTKRSSYKFIGIDATKDVGLMRLFNFFGELNQNKMNSIEFELKKSNDFNQTILFGHYPQSVINSDLTSTGLSLNELSRKYRYLAYLSGHLHTMYSMGTELKAMLDNGHLELESPDFAHENNVRLFAFDNDIMSFIDIKVDDKPKILVTNPKDCRYISELEPLHRMKDNQIRFLLFSQKEHTNIEVYIDGELINAEVDRLKSPVYQTSWDSSKYSSGLHDLKIVVKFDEEEFVQNQKFSLDGTQPNLTFKSFIGRMVLLTNWTFTLRFFYFTFHLFLMISLIFKLGEIKNMKRNIYYFFLFSSIYLLIGPWMFIEIADNVFGAVFTIGLLRIDDYSFIPNVDVIHSFSICAIQNTLARNPTEFKKFTKYVRRNREHALTACAYEPSMINHIDKKLQNVEFYKQAVLSNLKILNELPQDWKYNKELLKSLIPRVRFDRLLLYIDLQFFNTNMAEDCVSLNGESLQYLDPEFRNDREFMLLAVKSFGFCLEYACDEFQNDIAFLKECVKYSPTCFEFIIEELRFNVDFIVELYKVNFQVFKQVKQKPERLILLAVEEHPRYLKFLTKNELNRKNVIDLILRHNQYSFLNSENVKIIENQELCEIVRKNGRIYKILPIEKKYDKRIVLSITDRDMMNHIPNYLKWTDIEVKWHSMMYFKLIRDVRKVENIKFNFIYFD